MMRWRPQEKIIDKEILCRVECSGHPIRLGDYPPDALVELDFTPYDHGNADHVSFVIYLAHERDNPNFAEKMAEYEAYKLELERRRK